MGHTWSQDVLGAAPGLAGPSIAWPAGMGSACSAAHNDSRHVELNYKKNEKESLWGPAARSTLG